MVLRSDGDIQARPWCVLVCLRKAAIVEILQRPRQLITMAMKFQPPFLPSDSYAVSFICKLFFIIKDVPSGLLLPRSFLDPLNMLFCRCSLLVWISIASCSFWTPPFFTTIFLVLFLPVLFSARAALFASTRSIHFSIPISSMVYRGCSCTAFLFELSADTVVVADAHWLSNLNMYLCGRS